MCRPRCSYVCKYKYTIVYLWYNVCMIRVCICTYTMYYRLSCMYVRMYICMYVCMYVYIYVCMYVVVCIFMYIRV